MHSSENDTQSKQLSDTTHNPTEGENRVRDVMSHERLSRKHLLVCRGYDTLIHKRPDERDGGHHCKPLWS